MKDCSHHNYILKNHHKLFKGHIFNFEADYCESCGSTLWSQNTDINYKIWLNNLLQKYPEIFTVNITTSLVCANIMEYLSKDLKIPLDNLIFKIINFCDYNKINYNFFVKEEEQVLISFSAEDYLKLDSLTKLSSVDKKEIIQIAYKISKKIVDDPQLYDLFNAFVLKR
jgi:hypothetical protein